MTSEPLNTGLKAALEYGPIAGFLVAYLLLKDDTFQIAGTEYTGFVTVTAAFIPVFLIAMGALWYLTGKIARMQVVTAVMLVAFGGLSVWLNDPVFIKMKPTAVYLILALILSVGLLRGQSWLKFVMEEMIPLRSKGWMILTKRVTALFFVSSAANELVWRTQSEAFWVLFETLGMPIVIFAFFMSQASLFAEYAKLKAPEKTS